MKLKDINSWKIYMENKYLREILVFIFLLIITFINDREDFSSPHTFHDELFVFLLLYSHVQFQRFFVLPFLKQRRYVKFSICSILTIFLFSAVAQSLDSYFTTVGWYDDFAGHTSTLTKYYISSFTVTLLLLLLVFFIQNYYQQQHLENKQNLLLKEMELKYLKMQTNPHFLFNALNSLYGISLEKPEEVSPKILQMAKIMRYQLELAKKDTVPLLEELDFLKEYMDFEAERIMENTQVDIKVLYHAADLQSFVIVPMLGIFFIENAFKHVGANSQGNFLRIQLSFENLSLKIQIQNSMDRNFRNPNSLAIGIENVSKRLDLLYPNQYLLKQELENDVFNLSFELYFTSEGR